MNLNKAFLLKCYKISQKSTVSRAKYGCVIASKKNPLIWAYNPSFYGLDKKFTLHAEEFAILKANRLNIFNRYNSLDMYIFRFNNDGQMRISKPCIKCQRLLKVYEQIANITYFDGKNIVYKKHHEISDL